MRAGRGVRDTRKQVRRVRWQLAAIVSAVVLAGVLIALPNALPDNILQRYPSFLPKSTVSLGLDLQGGSRAPKPIPQKG